jgi:hypothetical protein
MTETSGTFVDTKGKTYRYDPVGESGNVFKDAKGRTVYVLDSKEHRAALQTLRDKADANGKALRDTPLPLYAKAAIGASALTGAAIGTVTLGPIVGSAIGGGLGGTVAAALGGTIAAAAGGVMGAASAALPATAVANAKLHRNHPFLRDKIRVLETTGVERRAETLRDSVAHSTSGKKVALLECLLSTAGDTSEAVEEQLAKSLGTLQQGLETFNKDLATAASAPVRSSMGTQTEPVASTSTAPQA